MKRKLSLFFYFLSIYVIVQFVWWGYHIIDLTSKLSGNSPTTWRILVMIMGEGAVFLAILIYGIIRIKKSIKRELELSQKQTNFLLSVTHELKTPIASMKLYLQTLLKHPMNEEKRNEIIEKTLKQNEYFERLIDNILNAAQLENKRLVIHKEEINVSLFLKNIHEKYARQYNHIQFECNIQQAVYHEIDSFILETVINNLLENAIKYTGEAGKIIVELNKTDFLYIRVRDNGPGIPSKYQKDIFKKFYRIGNEETRTQKGSGLGLFIVKELVSLHKGEIKYYDNDSKGAVFELTL